MHNKWVKRKARKQKKAVPKPLENPPGRESLHHDLDHLAGTWSEEEYREFMEALREQRPIGTER